MNLFIHTIMYGYYALTTLGLKFKFNFVITLTNNTNDYWYYHNIFYFEMSRYS